jgi:hypothetical protein
MAWPDCERKGIVHSERAGCDREVREEGECGLHPQKGLNCSESAGC